LLRRRVPPARLTRLPLALLGQAWLSAPDEEEERQAPQPVAQPKRTQRVPQVRD